MCGAQRRLRMSSLDVLGPTVMTFAQLGQPPTGAQIAWGWKPYTALIQ